MRTRTLILLGALSCVELMGLKTTGASIPPVSVNPLRRWLHTRAMAGENIGSVDTAWRGFAMAQFPGTQTVTPIVAVWRINGTAPLLRGNIDGKLALDCLPTIGPTPINHMWRPGDTAGPFRIEFSDVYPPVAQASSLVPFPLSANMSAWVRKRAAGDATHARSFFGFAQVGDFAGGSVSRRNARAGLIGDGALGFRFGSVNCPDAPAGAVHNGAADIDANAVQPAALVNPGANWFHVRIKFIPPTPTQTGRWGAYLDGVLIATFATVTNFPRTSMTSIDVATSPYAGLEAVFAQWSDPVLQLAGYYIRDIQNWLDEDTTL